MYKVSYRAIAGTVISIGMEEVRGSVNSGANSARILRLVGSPVNHINRGKVYTSIFLGFSYSICAEETKWR